MALDRKDVIKFLKASKLEKKNSAATEYQDGVDCAIDCINASLDTRIDMLENDTVFSCEECIASLITTLENDCQYKEGNKEFDRGFEKTAKPVINSLQNYLTTIKHT